MAENDCAAGSQRAMCERSWAKTASSFSELHSRQPAGSTIDGRAVPSRIHTRESRIAQINMYTPRIGWLQSNGFATAAAACTVVAPRGVTGISRDPHSIAVHTAHRDVASRIRRTLTRIAPARIMIEERIAHPVRNSIVVMLSFPFVLRSPRRAAEVAAASALDCLRGRPTIPPRSRRRRSLFGNALAADLGRASGGSHT